MNFPSARFVKLARLLLKFASLVSILLAGNYPAWAGLPPGWSDADIVEGGADRNTRHLLDNNCIRKNSFSILLFNNYTHRILHKRRYLAGKIDVVDEFLVLLQKRNNHIIELISC